MTNPLDFARPLDLAPLASLVLAYLLGCCNAGYLLVRWKTGRDLRQFGSGNAGATNAGRLLGPGGFALTLTGDMLKGGLAVYVARLAGVSASNQVLVIAAVVAGHNWPLPLGFRGGKGVSASCGALLFFDPRLMLPLLGVCAVLLAATRRATISAMAAYALVPVSALVLGYDGPIVALLAALVGLVVFPHRQDLREELSPNRTARSPSKSSPAAPAPLLFKLASEDWEFEAIHRLNYRTFVEEIPQHPPNAERRLVDRFHAENKYVIALSAGRLAGMIALRMRRPFSLDAKVPALDRYLPAGLRPVEGRLLAVEPAFRRTAVFADLFSYTARHCRKAGFDLAVLSATTRQLRLYRHLGCTPFGPLVGTAQAPFQPMFLTLEAFGRTAGKSLALRRTLPDPASPPRPLNLLPGPVLTTPEVDAAFARPPVSHRGPEFLAQIDAVRRNLCALTGARHVQVLPGSGSLANAVVAAQLSLRDTEGLVISNGEFGERLAAEARSARLRFDTLELPWDAAIDLASVVKRASRLPTGGWIWWVHHETSTGRLNPLDELKALAARHQLRLCVDCISSIGSQPVDLRGVHLATGTSGKGLGAYPGLALVFHDYEPRAEPDLLPGYLDLGHWAAHESVPHTHSSNLVGALGAALRAITPERMARIGENTAWLRAKLSAQGWKLVVPDAAASPGMVTFALDETCAAAGLGEELERRGFSLNFRSSHLRARHWMQIALFGDPPRAGLEALLVAMGSARDVAPIAASQDLLLRRPALESVALSRA